ncbi:MAG: hypothetical protein JKY18_07525 [Flavobacteriales bacterium]|nr:hypothetical protein [Flavobacteriales bacterium]
MKKLFISAILLAGIYGETVAQSRYMVVTAVESIIPMGLGRSRLISHIESVNYKDFTTQRNKGNKSNQGSVRRKDIKINEIEESKLLNFYTGVGLNFRNIASNDAVITSKLNTMASEGWELAFVTSGVESDGGKSDGQGIFITRYIFKK